MAAKKKAKKRKVKKKAKALRHAAKEQGGAVRAYQAGALGGPVGSATARRALSRAMRQSNARARKAGKS